MQGLAIDVIDLIDGADVGVMKCGGGFRLPEKARLGLLVVE